LDELAGIARRHSLKLVYDAAHAFDVTVDGQSIGVYGDVSMFSLHATKVFHSVEGGLLMFREPALKRMFDLLKDFGIADEERVVLPGTNAKMNELEALMGLLVLEHLDGIIARRRDIDSVYREQLSGIDGLRIPPSPATNIRFNHGYFPIEIVPDRFGMNRDQLAEGLKKFNVFARKYFFPLIPDYECYRGKGPRAQLPVARQVAEHILCLPIYDSLALEDAGKISQIIQMLAASS
jgi:dTDP-4-amino-4,6-dideoxygalactose transaminase